MATKNDPDEMLKAAAQGSILPRNTMAQIAHESGISKQAVHRRAKKLGLRVATPGGVPGTYRVKGKPPKCHDEMKPHGCSAPGKWRYICRTCGRTVTVKPPRTPRALGLLYEELDEYPALLLFLKRLADAPELAKRAEMALKSLEKAGEDLALRELWRHASAAGLAPEAIVIKAASSRSPSQVAKILEAM